MVNASVLLGASDGRRGYPFGMSTVSDVRRANLKALVARHGGIPAFAGKTDSSEEHVRQLLRGGKSGRDMGNRVARRIEAKLGMREGAMDRPLSPDAPAPAQAGWDEDFMRYCIVEYETVLQTIKKNHPPEHKAKVLLKMYGTWVGTGERPSRAVILQFIQRAA